MKVLVVDDERDARELLDGVLTAAGATVLVAESASEAVELVRSRSLDVLISDIGMPDRDGHQLIREIRALPAAQGGRIAAIALTAFARSEDRTQSLLAGYHVHMAKPIEVRELIVNVASLVGRIGATSPT